MIARVGFASLLLGLVVSASARTTGGFAPARAEPHGLPGVTVTPIVGQRSDFHADSGAYLTQFVVRNTQAPTVTETFALTCVSSANVACTSVSPEPVTLIGQTEITVAVSWNALSIGGSASSGLGAVVAQERSFGANQWQIEEFRADPLGHVYWSQTKSFADGTQLEQRSQFSLQTGALTARAAAFPPNPTASTLYPDEVTRPPRARAVSFARAKCSGA